MNVRKAVLIVLMFALPILAEVNTNNSVSVSQSAQTVAIGTASIPAYDVLVVNESTSANEFYFRLFDCSETPASATTASIRLEKGESRAYSRPRPALTDVRTPVGYCAISLVCATSETATARLEWQ